ncbi:RHS repeat-associated core domain-containing protein [Bosea vaviloviae]|uniref:RHS repeat-associated core domain-containing protein n=1 Tax=Bosea vaviloviae TaxID=1526658 RepID=UPI001314CAE5|nr:RHS repeat-associated core domain-containing protein [Bosea vaviloviae]
MTRTFGHDGAGNIATDTRGSAAWTFTHNAAGRLSQASVGGTLKGAYTYDGLERLAIRAVTNTTPSGTTHLIYDTAGHLLAEANAASGATIREYVWLEVDDLGSDTGPTSRPANDNAASGSKLGSAENDNDPSARTQLPSLNGPRRGIAQRAVPLAVVADVDTASPTTLFVHADHLDRPVRMTNASQALVWDAVYKPYGEVVSITGAATLDARFPGQWFQLETGLHYNWHRTYDPTTGRYLQTDPLGNVDGPSVYAYASGSPMMWTDQEGLFVLPVLAATPAGAVAVGAVAGLGALAAKQIIDFCMGKGERNYAGSIYGTKNPFKHMRPDPSDPNKVIVKDPQTGKQISKQKPPGFDESRDKK